MKYFIFLISLIHIKVFSNEQNEINHEEKHKKKYILSHYFLSKIKKKTENKIDNYLIKGDNDELSYDFNFWEKMQYKGYKSNKKKNENNLYTKYNGNNKFIEHMTKELNVIKDDYKMNDLITKFNNRKFNNENIINSNIENNNKKNNIE